MIYNYHLLFKYIVVGDASTNLNIKMWVKAPSCFVSSMINLLKTTNRLWGLNSAQRSLQWVAQ